MFSEHEKARIRYHLGYTNVTSVSTFSLGVPANVQTTYLLEGAFNKMLPEGETLVRELIPRLDAIDLQIFENSEFLVAASVDEIQMRPDEMQRLIDRYEWCRRSLGNAMGVPPNPFDQRFVGGGTSINARVTG